MPLVRLLICLSLVALAGFAAGCGDDEDGAPASAKTTKTAVAKPDDQCGASRPEQTVAAPKGLFVPDGTVVGEVASAPPNQKVSGFLPFTPDSFVEYMENQEDLGMLFKESEGFEAEVMVSDGKQRSFWKVIKACPEGSKFTVLTGEELAPGAAKDAIRAQKKSS